MFITPFYIFECFLSHTIYVVPVVLLAYVLMGDFITSSAHTGIILDLFTLLTPFFLLGNGVPSLTPAISVTLSKWKYRDVIR